MMAGANAQEAAPRDAVSAFMERASLRSADDHCELLTRNERLALDMGYWQSYGALLRGGFELDELTAMHNETTDYASTKPCDDKAMTAATEKLKNAFLAFSRTPFFEFHNSQSTWTASRTLTDVWGTYQENSKTNSRMGLVHLKRARDPLAFAKPGEKRDPPQLGAMLRLAKGDKLPATARLIARDPAKNAEPWLGGLFGDAGTLSAPPRAFSSAYFAAGREVVDARPYEDGDATNGILFLFGSDALRALEALDPREAVVIEFAPSDRDKGGKLIRSVFEVGDFKAAAAFTLISREQSS